MGLFSPQISTKKIMPLCRKLSTAYDAGIPIVQSLKLVSNQTKDRKMHGVLERMGDTIDQGGTLGQAAARESEFLPPFFIQLLECGERGGRLDAMLKDLADYYEDRLKMKRQITSAMIYPGLQLTAAWFLGTFAMRAVGMVGTSAFDLDAFITSYLIFQAKAMGIFGIVLLICAFLARIGIFKWIWCGFTTFMWPVSKLTQKFALARFFRSLSLLIGSGLPIVQCIERSATATTNPYIEEDLLKAVPFVKDSCTLVQAFSATKYLTPTAHAMIQVGEQSGELEAMLRKIADYHLEEADHTVKKLIPIIFISILIAVGVMIGYVVISFWQKLYGGMLDGLGV